MEFTKFKCFFTGFRLNPVNSSDRSIHSLSAFRADRAAFLATKQIENARQNAETKQNQEQQTICAADLLAFASITTIRIGADNLHRVCLLVVTILYHAKREKSSLNQKKRGDHVRNKHVIANPKTN